MHIAEAIEVVRKNGKIARSTWKDGVFIYLVPSQVVEYFHLRGSAKEAADIRTKFENGVEGSSRWINPHFDMINEFGQIEVGWKANAGDLLASDWYEVSIPESK